MTTRDDILKQITAITNGAASDAKVLKRKFNSQIIEEVESNEQDIIRNYNAGFIEEEELFKQKIANLEYGLKNIFKFEETK